MIVEFLPEAKSELLDAVAYYEGELNGLGQRRWDEVHEHIAWIGANHEVPRLRTGGYRRVNLRIFPYFISYVVRDPQKCLPGSGHRWPAIAGAGYTPRPSPNSVMKNASATTGNAKPTHAASVHPPTAYAQPPSAEPTAQPMKKAAT